MLRLASLLLALAVLPGPVLAKSKAPAAVGLKSFAAVQAPEAATEVCHAGTPKAAQECANAKCRKKAGKGACFALTVCAPGGWAGIMGVRVTEVSFSDVLCGAPSKDALLAAMRAYCRGHLPQMQQCFVGQIWSPDGTPEKADQSWSPADFK